MYEGGYPVQSRNFFVSAFTVSRLDVTIKFYIQLLYALPGATWNTIGLKRCFIYIKVK
jgi:hypothetical protein